MKKFCCLMALCVLAFALCACEKYSVDGIENFPGNFCEYELNVYLLPDEDFLEKYEYTDIDYHYRSEYETYISIGGTERLLLYVEYEQETYEEAKTYCLQNLQLSENNCIEYNGYTFIENIELSIGQEPYGNSFPEWFNMFAYNDEQRRLVFIGFYSPDYALADTENVRNNWGEFLDKHFSDIYDWNMKGY